MLKKFESTDETEKIKSKLKEQQVGELRGTVNMKMKEIEKLVSGLHEMEGKLQRCQCQQYNSVIERYKGLKEQCGEVDIIPKFEVDSLRSMNDNLKDSLQIMTQELERQGQKNTKQDEDRKREVSDYKSKIEELRRTIDIIEEEKRNMLVNIKTFNKE